MMTKQELGRVEYHRNGSGGVGYFMVTLSGSNDPQTGTMLGIVPGEDIYLGEDGSLRPSKGRDAHMPRLLVLELNNLIPWAEGAYATNWRGADHWSEEFMAAIHKNKCADRQIYIRCTECFPGIGTPEWTTK